MSPLRQDLRFALRPRRRGRLASLIAIASLALGIAGNSLVFSLADAMIFRPLPYPEPEQIVLLGQREEDQPDLAVLSLASAHAVWADYRERSRTLIDWAALNPGFMSLSEGDRSVPVTGARVTPSLFRVLGGRAARGRLFTDAEAVEGGPNVALLSWEHWRDSFGLDSNPVGAVLTLDGEPYEVIGALSEGFEFILPDVDVWLPLQRSPYARSRDSRNVLSVARMAPGVTMAQVDAEVTAIAEDLEREYPDAFRGWTMDAINLSSEFPDHQSRLYMGLVQASLLMVLLIACANIAILLVARGQERRREMAIRTALGAGRLHILGQVMRESLVVAAIGGVAGLALAAVGIRPLSGAFAPNVMQAWNPALDTRVVLFALAITVLSGLVFGLIPALQSLKTNPVEALKEGGAAGSGGDRQRGWVSPALVVAEVAISLVALGVGSVLMRSLLNVKNQDPGFEVDGLLTVRFSVPYWKYADAAEGLVVVEEAEARAAELTGVAAAAVVSQLPLDLFASTDTFRIDALPDGDPTALRRAVSLRVSPSYLGTLGVPLVRGRFFDPSDRADQPLVCVINQAMAESRFPGGSPVGGRITFRGESREVVGVAGNVRQSLGTQMSGEFRETIYVPTAQDPLLDAYLVLRTAGDARNVTDALRAEFWGLDPDVTVYRVQTMDQVARRYMVGFDLYNVLFTAFGVLALLLASLGTYGVVAFTVSQRSHEIGVRLAVGAQPREVVTMMAVQGLRMSIAGLLVGTLAVIPLVALVKNVLVGFGMTPAGGGVVVAVGAVLLAVTLVASLVPASGAARVDPVNVLKAG